MKLLLVCLLLILTSCKTTMPVDWSKMFWTHRDMQQQEREIKCTHYPDTCNLFNK